MTHVVCRARENMCAAVTPLLELISQCTGFKCLSLIAGSPPQSPGEPYIIGAVHYGKTNEIVARDFGTYNREGYRHNVVEEFQRFLRASKRKSCLFVLAINLSSTLKRIRTTKTQETCALSIPDRVR